MYSYLVRIRDMDEEAKRRIKIINHFNQFGLESTKDAFDVSKASIYRWKRVLENNPKNLKALNKKSTAPKNTRRRLIDPYLQADIIKLRTTYPRMGHVPMYYLLKNKHNVSKTTLGRILSDLKKKNLLPKIGYKPYIKKKIRKQRRKSKTGYEIDTVTRHINGIKWYFITAIDIQTRKVYCPIKKSFIKRNNKAT